MMPICFIAGPFRGPTAWDVAENVRHAERCGLEVAKMGGMPIIPQTNTQHFYGQLSEDSFWIPGYHRLLEVSDALVLIPGWMRSQGAVGERDKFVEWRRSDRIFDLDQGFTFDEARRLQAWIRTFAARPQAGARPPEGGDPARA